MNKFLFQALSGCFSSIIFNTCTITLVLNILNSTNRHFKVEKLNIKECANAREIERESRAMFLSPRPTPTPIRWPTVPYCRDPSPHVAHISWWRVAHILIRVNFIRISLRVHVARFSYPDSLKERHTTLTNITSERLPQMHPDD